MALINHKLKTLACLKLSRGRIVRIAAFALLAAITPGCGGTKWKDPPVIPVMPVSGTVKYGGAIPVGAVVTLVPVGRTEEGIASQGTVQADGTFKISTYGTEDGAPVGEYVVLVQWYKPLGGEDGNIGGPNVIPRNYSDPAKSPLKATVKEGTNEIPIVITRSV